MEVAGHTDSQGSDEGNRKLSQARAEAVITALSARRVLTRNLTPKGYGESQPIADNDTEKGREANRRIEFVLLDAKPVGGAEQIDLPVTPPVATAGTTPVAPIEAAPDLVLDESAVAGAAPMEEAHGEPMPVSPEGAAAVPPVAPPAEMTPPAEAEPAIEIPVNPAARSPGHPKPRPKKLGGLDN